MNSLPVTSTTLPSASDTSPRERVSLVVHKEGREVEARLPVLREFLSRSKVHVPLSLDPAWLMVLQKGLGHPFYCLEAITGGQTRGLLPLSYVRSLLFGRFLVSLPYLNYGGVTADSDEAAQVMIERAVALADQLNVRYLELRHEEPYESALLDRRLTSKVQMRLPLPADSETLWRRLDGKVRNQIRKAHKLPLREAWGGAELLSEFYDVFARNMRDLGTPVFDRGLFKAILEQFPNQAELCVVRLENRAVAAALLLHGRGVTEVPSASSLRAFNYTNANMLLYWRLLARAIERGQAWFDFGRCSLDSNTHRFKKQWGAEAFPADWQYHLRRGSIRDVRPENPRYGRAIRLWRKLPLFLTRWLGPHIVRGIP